MTNKIRKMVTTFTILTAMMLFGAATVSATPIYPEKCPGYVVDASIEATVEEVPELSDGSDIAELGIEGELEGENVFSDGYDDYYSELISAVCKYTIMLEENDDPYIEIGKVIDEFERQTESNPSIGTSYSVIIEEDGTEVHELFSKNQKCTIKYTPGKRNIIVICSTF